MISSQSTENIRDQISRVLRFSQQVMKLRRDIAPNFTGETQLKLDQIDTSVPGIEIGGPDDDFILRIEAPQRPLYPEPPEELAPWILGNPRTADWDDQYAYSLVLRMPINQVSREALRRLKQKQTRETLEGRSFALVRFEDDPRRVEAKSKFIKTLRGKSNPALADWIYVDSYGTTCFLPWQYLRIDTLSDDESRAVVERVAARNHQLLTGEANDTAGRASNVDDVPLTLEYSKVEESFAWNERRVQAYEAWRQSRKEWLEESTAYSKKKELYEKLAAMRLEIRNANLKREAAIGAYLFKSEPQTSPKVFYPLIAGEVVIDSAFMYRDKIPISCLEVRFSEEPPAVTTSIFTQYDEEVEFEAAGKDALEKLAKEEGSAAAMGKVDAETIQRIIALLSPTCRWSEQKSDKTMFAYGNRFAVYLDPVIFIRDRPIGLDKAIGSLADAIESGALDAPQHLKAVVCESDSQRPAVDTNEVQGSIAEQMAVAAGENDEILLTLPANAEQLGIAEVLKKTDGVLVQGPPGTGKTHTIANLIGHFLSEGQRVLVASEKAPALTVLKNKLPEEIRPLCISWLDSPAENCEGARRLAEKLESFSVEKLQREEIQLSSDREAVHEKLKQARSRLVANLQKEGETIAWGGDGWSLSSLAKALKELAPYANCIPGDVSASEGPFPLSRDELKQLLDGQGDWPIDVRKRLQAELPAEDLLPSPDEVEDWAEKSAKLSEKLKEAGLAYCKDKGSASAGGPCFAIVPEGSKDGSAFVFPKSAFGYLLKLPWEPAVDFLTANAKSPLIRFALEVGVQQCAEQQLVDRLIEDLNEAAQQRINSAPFLVRNEVAAGENEALLDDKDFLAAFKWFKTEHPDGNTGFFTNLFSGSKLAVLDQVQVNGAPIRSAEAIQAVSAAINMHAASRELKKSWDLIAGLCGERKFDDINLSVDELNTLYAGRLNRALKWKISEFKPLLDVLVSYGVQLNHLPTPSDISSKKAYIENAARFCNAIRPFFNALKTVEDHNAIEEKRAKVQDQLKKWPDFSQGIYETWRYKAAYQALRNTVNQKARLDQWLNLVQRLKSFAPDWANNIETAVNGANSNDSSLLYDSFCNSWKYKQLKIVFDLHAPGDINELQNNINSLRQSLREKTIKLACARAWLKAALRTKARELEYLKRAAGQLKRIGKGAGKKAELYRQEASKSLEVASTAVPAWIMTIDDALMAFKPSNPFDVVIVDEASQADISSIALLAMAKKMIVVGDDKQVSPIIIGQKNTQVDQLREHLLVGHVPHVYDYDLSKSLYEIVEPCFRTIMLREHFRCVPEIIEYSNSNFYDGRIIPLRQSDTKTVRPPFVLIRTDGDGEESNQHTNAAEARMIVRLMKACTKLHEYDGKTFGVVVMKSGTSGEQVKCIEAELQKHFSIAEQDERKIRVGLSKDFQGDERDVVFLSFVDSQPVQSGMLRKISEDHPDYRKRFNVAVSRARDQIWLVCSFDWKTMLAPGDIRKTLFDHAEKIVNADAFQLETELAADPNSLAFEVPVARELKCRGYCIRQQEKVGSYSIDIVVIDRNKRIAVECDGERWHSQRDQKLADLQRQSVLERIGWTFIRLRGSEYFADPEKAMDRLCEKLSAYGVNPTAEAVDLNKGDDLVERVKRLAFSDDELLPEKEEAAKAEEWPDADWQPEPADVSSSEHAGLDDETIVSPSVDRKEEDAAVESAAQDVLFETIGSADNNAEAFDYVAAYPEGKDNANENAAQNLAGIKENTSKPNRFSLVRERAATPEGRALLENCSNKLREIREAKPNLTLEAIGKKLGITAGYVSNIINRRQNTLPSKRVASKIDNLWSTVFKKDSVHTNNSLTQENAPATNDASAIDSERNDAGLNQKNTEDDALENEGIEELIRIAKESGWAVIDRRESKDKDVWIVVSAQTLSKIVPELKSKYGIRGMFIPRGSYLTGWCDAWRFTTK